MPGSLSVLQSRSSAFAERDTADLHGPLKTLTQGDNVRDAKESEGRSHHSTLHHILGLEWVLFKVARSATLINKL
jgi:hypothetical protein